MGALGWLSVLGLVLAAVAPGGSYLMALPALAGSVAGAVAVLARPSAAPTTVTAGAAVAVVVLAPVVLLFFPALGLATAAVPAAFAVLLGMALLPVLEVLLPGSGAADRRSGRSSRAAVATTAVVGVALVATGLVVDRFDADHPAPSQLMYALDADTGQARWVSEETDPGRWTVQYVERREGLGDAFPILGDDELATGPAPAADLPAPELSTVSDTVVGGQRRLTVRVRPQRDVRLVLLDVSAGAAVVGARAGGREVPPAVLGQRRLAVAFHGPPADGVEVGIAIAGTGPVTLRVLDGSDGLAGLPGFRTRPADVGVAGSHRSDLVVVARTRRLP